MSERSLRERVPTPVKAVVGHSTRTFGLLTSSSRILPGLLVCGGQRCGTTSLYRALAQHPAILKPVCHKGVHYFDTAYERGLAWYRAHFPTKAVARRIADHTGLAPVGFESSPYYLYHPLAARRFARDLPGVKVIVLVRDPVERAWSHHAHEVARDFDDIADFEAAVEAEPGRLLGAEQRLRIDPAHYSFDHQHHAYVARGRYTDYLEPLAQAVGRDRVLVLDSGEFFTRPEDVFERVLRFLGLPWLGEFAFARHNARGRPSPMSPALRRRLTDHYEPYDARLAEWLGRTPSWRR
ncbi:sulfotransferase [Glycomyces sp. L485]|uniref:sulfotransferase family protein n=1 Tax=Glycomyces sp. L485 TaxID=2909235 RepID=UPI001F4A98A5|nr:sulfotransferase [Glycomyces sp. L485]MCH7231442.1 sulfotransferase [Glycomyces sp. L485]